MPRGGVRRGLGVAGFMALGDGGAPATSERPAADPTRLPREAGVLHQPGRLCEQDQGVRAFPGPAEGSFFNRAAVKLCAAHPTGCCAASPVLTSHAAQQARPGSQPSKAEALVTRGVPQRAAALST